MEEIIKFLQDRNETISTMESASGGFLASSITNVSGSSLVFKFGAVTYSNEYKIKMGVDKSIIDKYSVYSLECAKDMSLKITLFTNSTYGVGVTGKINDYDPSNDFGDNATVFLSLYSKKDNKYYTKIVKVKNQSRELNKILLKDEFINLFKENIINQK